MALSSRANIRYRRGDWIAAQADADWGLGVANSTGRQLDISGCLVINALLDASIGRAGDLKSHLDDARAVLEDNTVRTTLAQVHYMQGLFELLSHQPDQAIETFERMRVVCDEGGLGEFAQWQWPADLVEAYVRASRTAEALPALQRLEAHAAATSRPILKALAARCRGLVTPDGFQPAFEEALDWHDKAGSRPFEKARTQLCFGERLRRAKQRAAARRQLEAARQTFAQLGATRWAKNAYEELEASGIHTISGTRSYTAQLEPLTHQEREVAMAVASGASNDEAAARLFLSTKTVEYHLSKVYRKLHASRSTLGKALEASVSDQETDGVLVS